MQASSTLVLCLFLVAFASASDLTELVNKISTPSKALLQSRSVEARQSSECTVYYHCNAVNQPCDYDFSDSTECTACSASFGACSSSTNENKTSCDCVVTVIDCLRATGKYMCDAFITSFFTTCESFCGPLNETSRCGDAPSGIPTVEICSTTSNSYCTTEGTCANAASLGGTCDPAEDIPASLAYVCSGPTGASDTVCNASGVCGVSDGSQYPNDGCANDDQCASGNCTNGLCVGLAVYEVCVGYGDCDFGLYCATNKTCLPFDSEGAACSLASGNCAEGLVCSNNTCVPLFSGAAGAPCFVFTECAVGTTCNSLTHTCGTAYVSKPCVNDTDCVDGTTCSCDNFDPTSLHCKPAGFFATAQISLTQDCVDRYKSLIACTNANKCSQTSGDLPSSCSLQHCASEQNCLLSCTIDALKASPDAGPAECLNYPTIPCGSTTQTGTETGGTETGDDSAASIFAPAAALLVALIALFA